MAKSARKQAQDCPPLALLGRADVQFPQLQRDVDYFVRNGSPTWHPACYIPMAGVIASAMRTVSQEAAELLAAELTAASVWRLNKTIFRFDVDLAAALFDQSEDLTLPIDALLRLPHPCIYVAVQQMIGSVQSLGFFASIEHDDNTGALELRLLWVMPDLRTYPGIVHLLPGGTIADGLAAAQSIINDNLVDRPTITISGSAWTDMFCLPTQQAIQLLLYLVADNSDMAPAVPFVPSFARAGHAIPGVTGIDVGIRVGGAFRRAARAVAASGGVTGASVRTHARRGHWHHYWSGPLKGDRKLVLHWIAPLIVNPDSSADIAAVIRVVK